METESDPFPPKGDCVCFLAWLDVTSPGPTITTYNSNLLWVPYNKSVLQSNKRNLNIDGNWSASLTQLRRFKMWLCSMTINIENALTPLMDLTNQTIEGPLKSASAHSHHFYSLYGTHKQFMGIPFYLSLLLYTPIQPITRTPCITATPYQNWEIHLSPKSVDAHPLTSRLRAWVWWRRSLGIGIWRLRLRSITLAHFPSYQAKYMYQEAEADFKRENILQMVHNQIWCLTKGIRGIQKNSNQVRVEPPTAHSVQFRWPCANKIPNIPTAAFLASVRDREPVILI